MGKIGSGKTTENIQLWEQITSKNNIGTLEDTLDHPSKQLSPKLKTNKQTKNKANSNNNKNVPHLMGSAGNMLIRIGRKNPIGRQTLSQQACH